MFCLIIISVNEED